MVLSFAAGIFGISIAVALRERGHKVTVFDRNDYSKNKYQNFELQVASVDQNKIVRLGPTVRV